MNKGAHKHFAGTGTHLKNQYTETRVLAFVWQGVVRGCDRAHRSCGG